MDQDLTQRLQWVASVLTRRGDAPPELAQPLPRAEPGVYWTTVKSADAYEHWLALRESTPYTGFWPVLLAGPPDEQWLLYEVEQGTTTAAQYLQDAKQRFYGDWMVHRHHRLHIRPEEEDWHEPWPEDVQPRTAFAPIGRPEIGLGLFPTTEGWKCPPYWRWWVANADLTPSDHCCVMRRWEAEYGAELVMMDGQAVLQFRVARPPRDRRRAMKLAVEHYLYCTDRVNQGTGTIERLAAELLDASVWYFWFD